MIGKFFHFSVLVKPKCPNAEMGLNAKSKINQGPSPTKVAYDFCRKLFEVHFSVLLVQAMELSIDCNSL